MRACFFVPGFSRILSLRSLTATAVSKIYKAAK